MSNTEPQDEDVPVTKLEQLAPELQRLLLRKALRTLARLEWLTGLNINLFAELLANDSPHHADRLAAMSTYLDGTWKRIAQKTAKRKCAECNRLIGWEIDVDDKGRPVFCKKATPRADARYCSPKCRQQAHRKRHHVTASAAPAETKPSRRNGSHRADNGVGVTAGPYDANRDFDESINECYRAVRERKATGGKGWPD
jgi:hypothetical protein